MPVSDSYIRNSGAWKWVLLNFMDTWKNAFFLHEKPWFRQELATGKYGCTEVRVYPAECGEQLGRDP